MSHIATQLSDRRIEHLLGSERLAVCVQACDDSFERGVGLYRWNAAISAALWQPLGHLEVAVRNAMAACLVDRHRRTGCAGSWLDDPGGTLDRRLRTHIALARRRVHQKGKRASDAQTISELGFGFWRYLLTRRHTALWPDLASAFAHAPDRRRETVEAPIGRLHELRNRIAHHQPIWNHDLAYRHDDLLLVAAFLDPGLPAWIEGDSPVADVLAARPLFGSA
jgi:hypothetical protein